ncbi:MAG: plasmid pRiA4b ORF-3 family protein [Terriglobales bacterium]
MTRIDSGPTQIYQIKITLHGSRPPIWRRLQVKSDITLAKLHRILQAVMGWTDSHFHRFLIQGKPYGIPGQDVISLAGTIDERRYKLEKVGLRATFRFTYSYDFGDAWEHALLVEKVLSPQEGARYPVCMAGERGCPPEDVGGMPGYEAFLAATSNPQHPEHKEYLEWIGGPFDPEAFDVSDINRRLHCIK